ncbi:hypothetical protein [Candidatus Vidania fulgoroideorum]
MLISVFDLDNTLINVDCEGLFYRIAYSKHLIDIEALITFRLFYIDYINGCFNPVEHFVYQLYSIIKFRLSNNTIFLNYFISSFIKPNINSLVFNKMLIRSNVIISTASIDFISSGIVSLLFLNKYLISTSIYNSNLGFSLINYGSGKVFNLLKWIKINNIIQYNIEFFTDSVNDLPLILKSNIVWLVNPSYYLVTKTTLFENRVVLFSKKTALV